MKPHMMISILAPLCGSAIPMGFNMGVLNLPQKFIRKWTQYSLLEKYEIVLTANEEVLLWTTLVSTFLIGAMIGALNSSRITDRIGRKKTFLVNHIICLTASLLFSASVYVNYVELFAISRFLSGICGGISSSLVPLYFSEVFPNHLKSVSGIIYAAGMRFGILLSFIAGMDIAIGGEDNWNLLPVITFLGSFGALLVHPFILENTSILEKTSYALINRNEEEIELDILQKHKTNSNDVSKQSDKDIWDLKRIMKSTELRMPLLLVVILFAANSLSGINGCWFYSAMIFSLSGLNTFESNLATISASAMNVIMCSVSFSIARKYSRRTHLLSCITGCVLSLASMSISLNFIQKNILFPYIAMASFIIFIIFFCIGLGALPFILAVELIPEGPRSVALSIGSTVLWTCNLFVSISFPLTNYYLGPFSLFIFISILIISEIFFYFFLPETFIKNPNN